MGALITWILTELLGGLFLKAYKDTFGHEFGEEPPKENPESLPRLPAPIDSENGSA